MQVASAGATSDWPSTYNDGVTLEMPLGVVTLRRGHYRVRFTCVGASALNPKGRCASRLP